jgi:hypothetical protein
MADGGVVKKKKPMKPHVPAKIKDPIAKSKHKLKRVKKADGGKVHGSPMSTPKPGGTTRKRPKVGDKDPNYKPSKPSKPPTSSKPTPKPGSRATTFRDYRGTKGAIKDAGG